jgi:hypothetical protein
MRTRAALTLVAASFAAVTVTTAPAQAAESCEWLAGDFHVHSVYSHDSYGGPDDPGTPADEFYTFGWTPGQQGLLAESRGLDFVAITDHNNLDGYEARDEPYTGTGVYESGWGQTDQVPGGEPLVWLPDYENSIGGHAQMHGATRIYDNDLGAPQVAEELRADGGAFQINHPSDMNWFDDNGDFLFPGFAPDTLEVWNIGTWLYQPPAPATNDHEFAFGMYDDFLDQGFHVAATGGSDTHWRSTSSLQGVGQPTTWVCANERSMRGILDGVLADRTTISHQPPNYGGAVANLFADGDSDGTFESMIGDTVVPGSQINAAVNGAPGATLRLITNGGTTLAEQPIDSPTFAETFDVPKDSTWVRAEVFYPDGRDERRELQPVCDLTEQIYQLGLSDEENYYCANRIAMVAVTSPIFFEAPHFDPSTALAYDGARSVQAGKRTQFSAVLSDSTGAPLAGQPVTFSFRGQDHSATTNEAGRAVVSNVQVKKPAGAYPVTSSFAGSDTYDPSTDRDDITVITGRS